MLRRLRPLVVMAVLLATRTLGRLLYRFELTWIDAPEGDPWAGIRVCALLHHTSLFDLLFVAALPCRVQWLLARRAVAPGADVTLDRPILGRLAGLLVHRMIPITRRRDDSWQRVLAAIDADAVVVIAPEGRMMRKNGLDKNGEPMTVRGGIADILELVENLPGHDRLLLAYSQGVHHVQAPGERLPRIFRTLAARLESLPIAEYVAARRAEAEHDGISFRDAVVRDLEARRAAQCPVPARSEPAP